MLRALHTPKRATCASPLRHRHVHSSDAAFATLATRRAWDDARHGTESTSRSQRSA
eukprot:IDg5729t1